MSRLNVAIHLFLQASTLRTTIAQDNLLAPLYIDNVEFLAASSNLANVSFPILQTALKSPNATNESFFTGYDWTKPFPGSAIDGHGAHLRVAFDIPIPDNILENATTAVSSLTFSIPNKMSGNDGAPTAMDPSWYICRHIFVTDKVNHTTVGKGGDSCGFLTSECKEDLKGNLTQGWMKTDDSTPCSGLALDPIPQSCIGSFGFARADVIAFDSSYMADAAQAKLLAVDEQNQNNWRIGTGYHDKGSQAAYDTANNRTFLLVNVWGYSEKLPQGNRKTPDATLSCLSTKTNATNPKDE
ncbi:hypothetical protein BT63DRAFT_460595 [Microthyrium microscopicum]|uniref:Uncharacterized protein n=1 Tax=Microthyrium microscopicum TaxID=703497 RepID=A0A6A6TX35_9PEZI|nr:hypothetical protein BT63DRAFT_460595 [Microthyrium microscopicum]